MAFEKSTAANPTTVCTSSRALALEINGNFVSITASRDES